MESWVEVRVRFSLEGKSRLLLAPLRHRSLSRRVPLGMAGRRRIWAGGPRATGRPAATATEWCRIRERVSSRGSDFDLDQLVALCCACDARTDAAYIHGRLMVTP